VGLGTDPVTERAYGLMPRDLIAPGKRRGSQHAARRTIKRVRISRTAPTTTTRSEPVPEVRVAHRCRTANLAPIEDANHLRLREWQRRESRESEWHAACSCRWTGQSGDRRRAATDRDEHLLEAVKAGSEISAVAANQRSGP
jgi:hypothetical protein